MAAKRKKKSQTRDLSIRNKAYFHIQRQIASGALRSGSAVSEVLLAKDLGSSRTPIREAIGQLIAEGLLEQSPNRGTVVVQLSREDIVDLYELREALEVYAVGKVARAPLRAADLGRLQKLVDDILVLKKELETSGAPALDAQQMNRFVACDLGFHALLMSMAVNARMQKIVNETRLLIRIFAIRRRGHDPAMLERIHRQHQEILDAVAKQQVEAAMRVLSAHIQTSKQERLEEFDYWKREASIRQSLPALFDVHNLASW